MTTPKVILSSTELSDRQYATGNSVLVSSLLVAVFNAFIWEMTSTPLAAVIAGVLSFIMSFGIAVSRNRQWATRRADFIQSIKEAVEKETGHVMTTKGIMAFLFSGEASDDNGATLKVKHDTKSISILLTKK